MSESSESHCRGGRFSFCFWAKLIVAIPALPLIAFLTASLFESALAQVLAACVAVTGVIAAAVLIDNIPVLRRKIRNNNDEAKN